MDLLRCFTVDYVSYELVPLDVTDPGSFGDLHEHLQDLDRIKEMDGVAQKIDIVFNNAGWRSAGLLVGHRRLDVANVVRHERHGRRAGGGDGAPHLADDATIVNVSSGLREHRAGDERRFQHAHPGRHLSLHQGCAEHDHACCAVELRGARAGQGDKVVSIDPGWVNTDMGSRGGTVKPPLEPEQVVRGMIDVVANLKPEDSGKFLSWEGEEMPW